MSNVTPGFNFHGGKWDRELRTCCTHPEVPAVAVKPLALLESWPDVIQQWVYKITLRLRGRLPTHCRKRKSHINSLTPWGRVLHQQAIVAQLVKKLSTPFTIQWPEQVAASLWPVFMQVTSLNLGWVTNSPQWGLSSVPPGKWKISPPYQVTTHSSTTLPIHFSVTIPPFDAMQTELLTAALHKP